MNMDSGVSNSAKEVQVKLRWEQNNAYILHFKTTWK